MQLSAIRRECRFRLRDEEKPYFWSNEWIDRKINEAEQEACLRGRLIKDVSSSVTSIDLVAGESRYALDPRIIDVLACELESSPGVPVTGWTLTESELVLARAPVAADVLLLTVIRYPLRDMESDDDEPEIRASHHTRLIDWVAYCAYSVADADTFTAGDSDKALAKFEQSFGRRPSSSVQVKQREKQGRVVRMNPF